MAEPVSYLSERLPWSAPSIIGPAPHNLPSRPQPGTTQQNVQITTETLNTRETYRYANLIDLNVTVGTTSFKFLDAPIGKRNQLGFRNASSGTQVIYIGFGRDATTSNWLALAAGTIILFDAVVPQDDLYCVASAAGAILAYVYSTFPG
ncbi:MAG: hypothetical protein EBS53_06315 [Bacteroidetes bacterium]|nr:hypothetical protein [Bacteroidota bacterium]